MSRPRTLRRMPRLATLVGGHADRTFKLPNPNYFLP